jgi:hypothetical protein
MTNRYSVFGLMLLFLALIVGCSSQPDSRSQMPKSTEDESGIQTKIFNLRYIRFSAINDKQDNPDFQSLAPKRVQDFIDKLNAIKSGKGLSTIDDKSHRLIISDTPQVLELAQGIISAEDKPPAQFYIKTALIDFDTPQDYTKILTEVANKHLDDALATIKNKYPVKVVKLPDGLVLDGQPGTYFIGEHDSDGTEKGLRASFLVQPATGPLISFSMKTSDTRNATTNKQAMTVALKCNKTIILPAGRTEHSIKNMGKGIILADYSSVSFWLVEIIKVKDKE